MAVPSGWERSVTPPSVIVPSTSISRILICAARFLRAGEAFAMRDNGSSVNVETESLSGMDGISDISNQISGGRKRLYRREHRVPAECAENTIARNGGLT